MRKWSTILRISVIVLEAAIGILALVGDHEG